MIETLVFTYGSLRSRSDHPMAGVLAEHATLRGAATFRGVLLDVGPYPAVVPSADEADVVLGDLYELDRAHVADVLECLDRYEGCDVEDASRGLYVRRLHDVRSEDGGVQPAWIWIWNRPTDELARIAHGDWLRHQRGD